MKVLIAGATGTLGHKLCQLWAERFECVATVRGERDASLEALLGSPEMIAGVNAVDGATLRAAVERARPDVVVNCIGAVKQVESGQRPLPAIRINSLCPHELAVACSARGARLIHTFTDCVFSGSRGGYTEEDVPDATDVYGRSKLLGEVSGDGALTVRTSLIGRELLSSTGLLEWLLSNRGGEVRGFSRAVFSGLTTIGLAGEIGALIEEHQDLDGVWHLAAEPIDKLDLLTRLNDRLELGMQVIPDDSVVIDRSLNSSRLVEATGREPRSWGEMIDELALDTTPYDEIRRELAQR